MFILSCKEVSLLCQVAKTPRGHWGIRTHMQKQSLYWSSGLDLHCAQLSRTRSESQLSWGGVPIIAEVGVRVLRFRTPDWYVLPCEQSEKSISREPECWGSSGCVLDTAPGFTTNISSHWMSHRDMKEYYEPWIPYPAANSMSVLSKDRSARKKRRPLREGAHAGHTR